MSTVGQVVISLAEPCVRLVEQDRCSPVYSGRHPISAYIFLLSQPGSLMHYLGLLEFPDGICDALQSQHTNMFESSTSTKKEKSLHFLTRCLPARVMIYCTIPISRQTHYIGSFAPVFALTKSSFSCSMIAVLSQTPAFHF